MNVLMDLNQTLSYYGGRVAWKVIVMMKARMLHIQSISAINVLGGTLAKNNLQTS